MTRTAGTFLAAWLLAAQAAAQTYAPPPYQPPPWPVANQAQADSGQVVPATALEPPAQVAVPWDATSQAPAGPPPAPLSPRREPDHLALPRRAAPAERESGSGIAGSLLAMSGSLAIVVGLFFVSAWALRRSLPTGMQRLPGEVVEVLGQTPLANRQQAQLLRVGNKLVLVSVSSAGADALAEITDPLEVDRLAGLCKQAQPTSTTASFSQLMQQFAHESDGAAWWAPWRRGAPSPADFDADEGDRA